MRQLRNYFIVLLAVTSLATSAYFGGVAGCGGSGGGVPDSTAPTVSSTVPLNDVTDVFLNGAIAVTFSEGMIPPTISTTTFTLKQGLTPVLGTVVYSGVTAVFTPINNLEVNKVYTATITTGTRDLAGNPLASNYEWTFTTGTTIDTAAPTVSFTAPIDDTTGVSLNQTISATFNEAMDPLTITSATFTLKQGLTPVLGAVTSVGSVATFNPTSDLAASTEYTAAFTTGVKDLAGNALAVAYTWTFTTGATADTTAPTVSSTNPADVATEVVVNRNAIATFSEAMDPLTITAGTFTLKQGLTPVLGAVTSVGSVATFNPTSDLAASTEYTAAFTTGVKDLAGNALAVAYTWTFTTGADVALGPAPVILGTAGNFVILTKSGITNVPTSAITGDIGTSPITGAAIAGMGCGEISERVRSQVPLLLDWVVER